MHPTLRSFIEKCHREPSAKCAAKTFVRAFRASLPAAEREQWPRTRILLELAAGGFPIGNVAGVTAIGSLSVDAPAGFVVRDGKLAMAS
jgi:hypothetical protein